MESPGKRVVDELRTNKYARRAVYTVGAAYALAGGAAAQVSEASGLICGTGIGQAVGIGLGAAIIGLIILAAARGIWAFKKLGAAREDKKREGREQAVGAVYTLGGVFVPGALAVLFELLGIGGISCIEWGNIVPGLGSGTAAVVVPVVTSLPF